MKSITQVEFDDMINGTTDICIGFTRTTAWSTDPSYGSDADGNRGIPMTDIDEDTYTSIKVSWDDAATGNAHNDIPFEDLPIDWQSTF